MKKVFFSIVLLLAVSAHAWGLKTGTYALSGGNGSWSGGNYQGEVVITPQGTNYSVTWRIGNRQTQMGIGVLQDDILSVAFIDVANPSFWGVASYRVSFFGEQLKGIWAAINETVTKPEDLVWKSHSTY